VRGFKQTADRNPTLLMIKYRADPNRMSFPGRNESALMTVVPDLDFMTALLALGADPNYHDASGTTALLLTVRAPEATTVPEVESARLRSARLLLDHGADASAEDANGSSALKETRASDSALVALLLAHGATWRLSDMDLASYRAQGLPIGRASWAVLQHKDALAAAELTHGAPLSAQDCGLTYYAAASGAALTLDALIRHKGARADLRDSRGWSPLLAAAADGQVATLRLLLDNHFGDVNDHAPVTMVNAADLPATVVFGGSATRGGETVLMLAAGANAADALEELLRRGARIDARDAVGMTALDYAERNMANKSVKILLDHGAKGGLRAQSFQ
jgi:ankyrin repeat protein